MSSRRYLLWVVMPLFATWSLAVGCGDSGHTLGDARDAAAGATGTGGSSLGEDGGKAGAGGGGHGGAAGTGGAGGAGGIGGAGGAAACGVPPTVGCPSGQVCDEGTPGSCGGGFHAGRCLVLPGGCTADYNPVCGCDGHTYGNDCERVIARVQLDHVGACLSRADAGTDGSAPPLVDCANLTTCGSDQQVVRVVSPALGTNKCACVPMSSAGSCLDCATCGASICGAYGAACAGYSHELVLTCTQNG